MTFSLLISFDMITFVISKLRQPNKRLYSFTLRSLLKLLVLHNYTQGCDNQIKIKLKGLLKFFGYNFLALS